MRKIIARGFAVEFVSVIVLCLVACSPSVSTTTPSLEISAITPDAATNTPRPTAPNTAVPSATNTAVVPVEADVTIELPDGDAQRGLELVNRGECLVCHTLDQDIGPPWEAYDNVPAMGERAETRFLQDDYTGLATSAEQYLFESIVSADVFIVDGYSAGVMHRYYYTAQQMADAIAYLINFE